MIGSVGISSCKCNDGFEGPDGGPCTLPKYPAGGCSAGSWAPSNECKVKDYLVYGWIVGAIKWMQSKRLFSIRYPCTDSERDPYWCVYDEACILCCKGYAQHIGCADLTPEPCTECPANSQVVISRAFFLFFPCNHIINIKKKNSFSGEAKDSVIFSFFILLHKRAKPAPLPWATP